MPDQVGHDEGRASGMTEKERLGMTEEIPGRARNEGLRVRKEEMSGMTEGERSVMTGKDGRA